MQSQILTIYRFLYTYRDGTNLAVDDFWIIISGE